MSFSTFSFYFEAGVLSANGNLTWRHVSTEVTAPPKGDALVCLMLYFLIVILLMFRK